MSPERRPNIEPVPPNAPRHSRIREGKLVDDPAPASARVVVPLIAIRSSSSSTLPSVTALTYRTPEHHVTIASNTVEHRTISRLAVNASRFHTPPPLV